MGRKIKHYSSGYQIRRKKQRRMISSVLFGLLLAILVGVGYIGAKAIAEMNRGKADPMQGLSSGVTDSLPDGSSGTVKDDKSSIPASDTSSEQESGGVESGKVETLYTEYGEVTSSYMPVKENPFTKYGTPVAAFIPSPDAPEPADDGELKAVTMPLETALSMYAARSFL